MATESLNLLDLRPSRRSSMEIKLGLAGYCRQVFTAVDVTTTSSLSGFFALRYRYIYSDGRLAIRKEKDGPADRQTICSAVT